MQRSLIIVLIACFGCTPRVIKDYSISYTPRAVLVTDYASTSSNVQGIIYRAGYRLDSYDSIGISSCQIMFTDTEVTKIVHRTASDDRGHFKIDFMPPGTYHIMFEIVDGRDRIIKDIKVFQDSIAFIRLNVGHEEQRRRIEQWD